MRVVHLTSELPWPATRSGALRTLSRLRLVSSLSEVDSITLVSVADRLVPRSELDALASAVPKLRPLPPVFHPSPPRPAPRHAVLRARGVPFVAARWASKPLQRALQSELDRAHVDVLYVDHLGMMCNLLEVKAQCAPAHTVLDPHNAEGDVLFPFATCDRGARKWIAAFEQRAAARFERRALQSVDAVIAGSIEDARRYEDLAGTSVHIVPSVLQARPRPQPAPASRPPRFCWVGNLHWRPNVAGLDWFCRNVWPLLRARLPEANFEIASVPPSPDKVRTVVPDAWNVPGVRSLEIAGDLEPVLARSTAMLAPVIGGSGIRTKLLDGFRVGLPVVTTPDGALGLSVKDGRELLIGKTPEAFADKLVSAATDEALRERLAVAGQSYLERRHSLEVVQGAMRAALGPSGFVVNR
ncbi:MAG: glycosyltransferase [Labilithrix sp.]|nr:glycosyltransferase [Labilithrix sp.]